MGGEIICCDVLIVLDVIWEFYDNISWVIVWFEFVGDGMCLILEYLMGRDKVSEVYWKKYGLGVMGVGWEYGFLGLGFYLKSGEVVFESEINIWLVILDG